jgi:hypothetical protein
MVKFPRRKLRKKKYRPNGLLVWPNGQVNQAWPNLVVFLDRTRSVIDPQYSLPSLVSHTRPRALHGLAAPPLFPGRSRPPLAPAWYGFTPPWGDLHLHLPDLIPEVSPIRPQPETLAYRGWFWPPPALASTAVCCRAAATDFSNVAICPH